MAYESKKGGLFEDEKPQPVQVEQLPFNDPAPEVKDDTQSLPTEPENVRLRLQGPWNLTSYTAFVPEMGKVVVDRTGVVLDATTAEMIVAGAHGVSLKIG